MNTGKGHLTHVTTFTGHLTHVTTGTDHMTHVTTFTGHLTHVTTSTGHLIHVTTGTGHLTHVTTGTGHLTHVTSITGHVIHVINEDLKLLKLNSAGSLKTKRRRIKSFFKVNGSDGKQDKQQLDIIQYRLDIIENSSVSLSNKLEAMLTKVSEAQNSSASKEILLLAKSFPKTWMN